MTGPRVLLTRRIGVASADAELDRRADVIVPASPSAADVLAVIGDVEGMIAVRPTTVTRAMLEGAPKLKVISALGSGSDHVDVDAASDLGIAVTSGAGVAAGAVAEFAVASMVLAHRRIIELHEGLIAGRPWGELKRTFGPGLDGSTVGVIGFGRIGRLVAQRAIAGFGCSVLAFDPFVTPSDADGPDGVRFCSSVEEVLAGSQTVTVHVPLSEDTDGLIGLSELAALGPEGVLVQASRGGVVDEAALLAALQEGVIKHAVIDVFVEEPPAPDLIAAFAATGRVTLTPHMASFTHQAVEDLAHAAVRDVLAVLAGERPESIVNRQQLDTRTQA